MDLLQAHLLRLDEGYGGDCGECMVRPFDWRYKLFIPNGLADWLGLELLELLSTQLSNNY